jgi:PKD repeat protein
MRMRHLLAIAATVLAALTLPAGAMADGQLAISPSAVSVVEYTPVTFNAQPLVAGETLTWSFDDAGATAVGPSVTHTFVGARRYAVTVTETDAGGTPTGTGTVAVDVTPYQVQVTAGPPQTQWTPAPSLPAIAAVSARDDAGNTDDDAVALTLLRRR